MTGERLAQMGWTYPGQPINTDFDVNWDSEQSRGLVAWWPMQGRGWPVPDRATYRYPLAQTNTPTWVNDGERGASISFDRAANEVLRVAAAPVTSFPYTLSCWVKPASPTLNQYIFGIGDSTVADEWTLFYYQGTTAGDPIALFRFDGVADFTTPTVGTTAGVWCHVCGVVASATSSAIYLNGGNKGTSVANYAPAGWDNVAIGTSPDSTPTGYFDGQISDPRVYNRALTDTEAYNLYAKPWELYAPRIYQQRAYVAAAAGAIMNQLQYSNLGADLYNGALIL